MTTQTMIVTGYPDSIDEDQIHDTCDELEESGLCMQGEYGILFEVPERGQKVRKEYPKWIRTLLSRAQHRGVDHLMLDQHADPDPILDS